MKSCKIIAIGAAVQDVFLQGKIFTPQKEEDEFVEEFKLGTKNDIEAVTFSTGGGATNTSVTFARQGLHSCFMGKIGRDVAGKAVLDELHRENVDTSLVKESKDLGTGYSTLLVAPNGERTILTYRGASAHHSLEKDDFHGVEADWFYLSTLDGDLSALKIIVEYARDNNIRIAINPGTKELEQKEEFLKLMPNFSIFSVNKEEIAILFGSEDIEEVLKKATQEVDMVVVTDGPRGVIASDGDNIYTAGMYEDVPVIDRTGAGDAFSSGFVSQVAQGHSIKEGIIFGSANSTSVVGKIGAKEGILNENSQLHGMDIKTSKL